MGFAQRKRFEWQMRGRSLPLGETTCVMGILNITPDSFSDGGQHDSAAEAVAHGLRLLDEGTTILDVGGESTRPGSSAGTHDAIAAEEEQRRILPVIQSVLRLRPDALLSVDTYHASTARAAVEAGVTIVNDVSGGLWDAAMLKTCAELECGVILMHTRGLPSEWSSFTPWPLHTVADRVFEGLRSRIGQATRRGILLERMVIDPGFGFGKRGAENWALLKDLGRFLELNLPLMAGLSRKGFLNPDTPAPSRDIETHAADVAAILAGAHIVRVHDVAGAMRASAAADAILNG